MTEESKLYIDIETIPVEGERLVNEFNSRIKPPGNYSNPESIKKWLDNEDNLKKARDKTALDGAWGSIFCIGYAIDNNPVECLAADTEVEMLRIFKALLVDENRRPRKLIGHYIKGFDLPFINKRMMVNRLGGLFEYGLKPWDYNAVCTGELFSMDARNIPSLDILCIALNVKSPKEKTKGSDVHQMYLNGEHDAIVKYCKDDVIATRECYLEMMRADG